MFKCMGIYKMWTENIRKYAIFIFLTILKILYIQYMLLPPLFWPYFHVSVLQPPNTFWILTIFVLPPKEMDPFILNLIWWDCTEHGAPMYLTQLLQHMVCYYEIKYVTLGTKHYHFFKQKWSHT